MDETQRKRARDKLTLDAERYKASVEKPKGTSIIDPNFNSLNLNELKRWVLQNEDDEFFHLTCHVDPSLHAKISEGGFVDLNKLLPKNRFQTMSEDQKMHMVNRNSEMFWVPVDSEQKISGVRRWEQAFRVYAAIYCKANPDRSHEIWQYVYVINSAASSYSWENVAYYDFTFRQLMAENPHRSWSKLYHQLWNLAMCEPLQKTPSQQANSANRDLKGNWRDRCCWRFNRGERCKKWKCHFDHHCKVCGSFDHSAVQCPKKGKGKDSSERGDRMSHKSDQSHKHVNK